MPGITYTPGTDWPVRPLAQYTRPLVWPQPTKSLPKVVPDQFQNRWINDEPAVAVPTSEAIAWEEKRFLEGEDADPADIGLVAPYIEDPDLNYPDYSSSESIGSEGARYHDNADYPSVWSPRRFAISVPEIPKIPRDTYTWNLDYSLTGGEFKAHHVPYVKWPAYACSLLGWPETLVTSDLELESTEVAAPYTFSTLTGGTNTSDYLTRSVQFWAEEDEGFLDNNANLIFRELLSLTTYLTCHVNWTRVTDGTAPGTPDKVYHDMSGITVTDVLIHKSQPFPALIDLNIPDVTYYSRKCWAGGGILIFPPIDPEI